MSSHKEPASFEQAAQDYLAPGVAHRRLEMLFDDGVFTRLDPFCSVGDQPCGVVCGHGFVNESPVCAFAQEGGGLGKMQAAKIAKLYDLALKTGIPVVGIYDSLGARVTEGVDALEAYGQLLLRINNLSGVVPQISLVLGDCTGISAMLACSADFVVMDQNANFFMTPPALSEDKVENVGSAENAAKAGVAHIVAETDAAACESARKLLALLPANNLASCPQLPFTAPENELTSESCEDADPAVLAASIADSGSLVPLMENFAPGAYTAFAALGGIPVGILAAKDKLDADCCSKMAKMLSVCDAYQIQVITLVDCAGFAPSAKAELCGAVRQMAKLGHVYAEATTPKIALITGRAYGAAYVALAGHAANCDYTIAWPGAIISALEPQTAVAFIHADEISEENSREDIMRDYLADVASPLAVAKAGYLDDVIEPQRTRDVLLYAMQMLRAKRVQKHPKKHSNLPM